MLNVLITPTPALIRDDNGIGRIVHAQYAHLPRYGIQLVETPQQADVIACHIEGRDLPRIDCLHVHGLYWSDIPHEKYAGWHHEANRRVAASARRAHTITVPSPWVGHAFARDMRLSPVVIPHGLDLAQWEPAAEHKGYVLFNKNRSSDVCSIAPVVALADAGIRVVSTFGSDKHPYLIVTGTQPHDRMRELIRHAAVYLATTPETFGIGTLEAMACGVPILGYDWCGTADLVQHQVNGYLATPGDTEGLRRGHAYVLEHRERLGTAARHTAQSYGWDGVMARYADLYYATADAIRSEQHRVSVVVTNFNYGAFLPAAIESVVDHAEEVIVVDDGSTDDSLDRLAPYADRVSVISQPNAGVAAARNNGIAAATGDYIVCLDADDTLDPRYLQVCRDALKADRGLGIAYTGLGLIQENGAISPAAFPPEFDWAIQASPANPPATCVPTAAMFRRSMWERAGGYVQLYAPGEDAEFYTRGLSIGYTARKVDGEPLIHYRAHAGSASRTKQYRPIDMWHPWMRDGMVPFAAPTKATIPVRSYALPLVSVIIPVGPGHARYLPAALDSLLGQTFRNWEALVINDGTGGAAWDRIKQTYPFIRLWETHDLDGDGNPMGAGFARNVGIEHARAPLVLFLDADDWLHPLALQQMLMTYAQHGKYVYTDWVAVKDGSAEPRPSRDYDAMLWLPDSGTSSGLHSVTVLMETAHARTVGGFDASLVSWEDWDFFCKLAVHGYCGQRLAEPLLFYRVHGGTRRELAHVAPGLRDTIRKRYAAYRDGKEPLMACCGNNGPLMGQVAGAMMGDAYQGGDIPEGKVLVRYTGKQRGDVQYSGSRLRGKYRVSADTPLFLAMKEDAEWFQFQADFRIEEPPAPVVATAPDPVLAILGAQSGERRDYGTQDQPRTRSEVQALTPVEGADTFPVIPPDAVQALQARAQRRGG